jgi:hypothetical protein
MSDGVLIRPRPFEAGHPLNHGFVLCSMCLTWIPERTAIAAGVEWHCADAEWCAKEQTFTPRESTP